MKKFNIRPAMARLMALIVLLSAVVIPGAAKPASASVLPLLLWSNVPLPTQNPNVNGASRIGWTLPAAALPGLDVAAADSPDAAALPSGHIQYEIMRSPAFSCHTVVGVAWKSAGVPYRGLGIWDNCQYNGWIWFRMYSEMQSGPDQFIANGRFRTQTLKNGSTWNTYLWHQGFQAWIWIVGTDGTGPHATGEVGFRYTQGPGFGGCAALPRVRVDGINVMSTKGWIDASTVRTLVPAGGCFAGSGWGFTEQLTYPNFIRANTP